MGPKKSASPEKKRKSADEPTKGTPKRSKQWTAEEDEALMMAVVEDRNRRQQHEEDDNDEIAEEEEEDWDEISKSVTGKTPVQCLQRHMYLNTKQTSEASAPAGASAASISGGGDGDESEVAKPKPVEGEIWEPNDVELLQKLVEQYENTPPRWNEISVNFPGRTAIDCLSRWQMLASPPVIKGKGSWTTDEDKILLEKHKEYGRKWSKIAPYLPGRQGKQCRERFVNHLDPGLKKGDWTDNDEAILIAMHQRYGNKWASIAKQLPGRSDNDVKNHWYSTIQRKYSQHGKQKLIDAAVKQVDMMQTLGHLPTQAREGWPPGPYNQVVAHPQPGYRLYSPGHFTHSPGAPGVYPYPPPPGPPHGAALPGQQGSPYPPYPPHQYGPPPPHYPYAPHDYYPPRHPVESPGGTGRGPAPAEVSVGTPREGSKRNGESESESGHGGREFPRQYGGAPPPPQPQFMTKSPPRDLPQNQVSPPQEEQRRRGERRSKRSREA